MDPCSLLCDKSIFENPKFCKPSGIVPVNLAHSSRVVTDTKVRCIYYSTRTQKPTVPIIRQAEVCQVTGYATHRDRWDSTREKISFNTIDYMDGDDNDDDEPIIIIIFIYHGIEPDR